MRIFAGLSWRIALASVSLAIVMVCTGCRSVPQPLFIASGPGWHVQEGQALWRPRRGFPELAGELVLASGGQGECLIQFAKTPMTLVSAQTTRTNWLIQFPAGARSFSGRRRPPSRFAWLHLQKALMGEKVDAPLRFERKPDGGWRLENTRTGETLEGFLAP